MFPPRKICIGCKIISLASSKYLYIMVIISEAEVVKEKAKPVPEKKSKSYH